MTDSGSLTELLARFCSGSDRLIDLVSGLEDAQLDEAMAPGEWTIRQIIHHLADDGDVYSFILKKAMALPGTTVNMGVFPGNEPWANALQTSQRPVKAALHLIQAHRECIVELASAFPDRLDHSVTFKAENEGEICFSVEAMIGMLSEHMEEHVSTIEAILAKSKHNKGWREFHE